MTSPGLKHILANKAITPVVVTVLCLVPFAGKAFHIDDTLFILSAKQIRSNPADFYGFAVNWDGTAKPAAGVIKNPPGCSYYTALAGLLFGWGEAALHMAFLVPAVLAALGTYYLAREFCSWPAVAALAAVLTPSFLVSSTNIMCDTMMLALWVWAVFFWVRGMKENKQPSLLFGAVLIAACALTKYFGITLLGLLFVYSLVQRRKLGVWTLFLLIPVAILAGYSLVSHALYARNLLFDAASCATGHRYVAGAKLYSNLITGLAFTGGGVITGLFYVWLLWSRRILVIEVLLVVLLVSSLFFVGKIGNFSIYDDGRVEWGFLIQLVLMVLGGVSIFCLAGSDFWRHKDSDSLLLLLWVAGTFIFGSFINWTLNARSILPMVPAVGILLMRRIESRCQGGFRIKHWLLFKPLIAAMVVSLFVCWADYAWADSARKAAAAFDERFKGRTDTVWFQGHWGFQYYMESYGYKPFDIRRPKLATGDVIIFPRHQCFLKPLSEEQVRVEKVFQFAQCRWLSTMNPRLGAGFYITLWGPLPFAIGPVAPESYYVFIAN